MTNRSFLTKTLYFITSFFFVIFNSSAKELENPDFASPCISWQFNDLPESIEISPPQDIHTLLPSNPPRYEDFYKWERSNANNSSNRYSSHDQINRQNIKNLEIKFIYRSRKSPSNIQVNPIIIGSKAIFPVSEEILVAINAANGDLIWEINTSHSIAKRGLVYWSGNKKVSPRIFFGSGGNLNAISVENGLPIKAFGINGVAGIGKNVTAPVIVGESIIYSVIGDDDHDPGIVALDAGNGKLLWRTSLIKPPTNAQLLCMQNWGGYKLKGASPWSGISADTERGLVFVTTGDAKGANLNRPGANEYANSIVAIDASSGKIVWSFQEISHDLWDLDVSAPPLLTSLWKNGKIVDVVVAVTKLGNTIILQRESGELLFPWRVIRHPEATRDNFVAPYFPDPDLPENFSSNKFSLDQLSNIVASDPAEASRLTNHLIYAFPPSTRFLNGDETLVFGISGGAEWPGAAIDPFKSVMYVASNNTGRILPSFREFLDKDGYPANKTPWGKLTALDLNTGRKLWEVPLGIDSSLEKRGIKNTGTKNLCGPVVTKGGLVFCGGTTDKLIRAFDQDTGEELWSYEMPAYGSAPPSVYEVEGKQYILIPATGGNNGTLFAKPYEISDTFIAFGLRE